MKTVLTNKLATILERAEMDANVGSRAMEMLRHYATDYEFMHESKDGVYFGEEAKRFAIPTELQSGMTTKQDGKKSKVLKDPFDGMTHEMQCRILEEHFFNLISEPVQAYWNELNEAVLEYLELARKPRSKLMTSRSQTAQPFPKP